MVIILAITAPGCSASGWAIQCPFAMKKLVIAIFAATMCLSAQAVVPLENVRKVYIEKMANNLDDYLAAAISKKFHGALTVVLDPGKADAILTASAQGPHDTTKAIVSLVDPRGKIVLWSGAAGDRDIMFLNLKHGGERKVADHLIGELHKAMEEK